MKVARGREPQVAVAPDGTIYVAFGNDNAVWCSASTDGGKTFGAPVQVAQAGNLALGMRRGPRIAATEKALVVAAVCGGHGHNAAMDLQAWRSTDHGKTWQAPVRLNSDAGAAREGLHGLAAGGGEHVYCVWLDLRRGKTELYGAASSDGGATWGADAQLYKSAAGNICECCHPSVALDAKGNALVMFRNWLGGSRDMYYLKVGAGGKVAEAAKKLGAGTWPLKGCPMDGGAIAAAADGAPLTIWRRARSIFFDVPGQPERELGGGEQAWIAGGPKGAHMVWLTGRGGDLMYQPPSGAATRLSGKASDPVIASAPGAKTPVVVAWQSEDEILLQVVAASER
ncbi:MAG: exo-alpha-sialidase [Planctomycetes bacterium]|nr:exo-alpha-sialidase [Planctomycetota bacterium]